MERSENANRPRISYERVNRKVTTKDLKRVNLGRAFWMTKADGVQDADVREVVVRYQDRIDEMIESGSGVLFTGPAGVGKTSAAACLMKKAISRGYSAYFVTHDELREIRFDGTKLFGDGSDGVTVKQKVDRAKFLVLDNFNAPFLTDKAFGPVELERLIAKRNSMMLTTCLTTRVGASISKCEDLFEVIKSSMAPVQMKGRNMRDDIQSELMQRVHGGCDE